MSVHVWRRSDVDLNQLWECDGVIYKVVGLIDDPVVVLTRLDDQPGLRRDPTLREREHHVIGSPNFAKFTRLDKKRPEGE